MTESEVSAVIEARCVEADALFQAGRTWLELTVRMLGVGVTLIGAAATLGLANDRPEVLLAVPIALSLIFTYQLQVYADVIAMGSARKELERVLALDLGAEAFIYETKVAPLRHGGRDNLSIPATQVFYFAIILGSAVAGAFVAAGNTTREIAYYVTAAAALALVTAAWRDMSRTWQRSDEQIAGSLNAVGVRRSTDEDREPPTKPS